MGLATTGYRLQPVQIETTDDRAVARFTAQVTLIPPGTTEATALSIDGLNTIELEPAGHVKSDPSITTKTHNMHLRRLDASGIDVLAYNTPTGPLPPPAHRSRPSRQLGPTDRPRPPRRRHPELLSVV
jgi:hypothetical protein